MPINRQYDCHIEKSQGTYEKQQQNLLELVNELSNGHRSIYKNLSYFCSLKYKNKKQKIHEFPSSRNFKSNKIYAGYVC